jgi:hypothetical protein
VERFLHFNREAHMIICVCHSLEFYSIHIFLSFFYFSLFNNLTVATIKIRDLNFDSLDKRKKEDNVIELQGISFIYIFFTFLIL